MQAKLTITGRLPGLNEYINACRNDPHSGASMKRVSQERVMWAVMQQIRVKFRRPVWITYAWYEQDRRRDMSNISAFGIKVIEDALVRCGVLRDDGWKCIEGFGSSFAVDRARPRVVVTIREVEDAPDDD